MWGTRPPDLARARRLAGVLCAFLFWAAGAAPWLAAHGQWSAAALFYVVFAPFCHQSPERSFAWFGHPWAVCHRCAGIYGGLAAGVLLPRVLLERLLAPRLRRAWVLGAAVPLLFDSLLPVAGLWHNTAASRFASGALAGVMLGSMLVAGLAQLPAELRRAGMLRRRRSFRGDGS